MRIDPVSTLHGALDGLGPSRLPCARIGRGACPEWLPEPVRYSTHLTASNLATARLAELATAPPIPYSRWLEQVNREDRFEPRTVGAAAAAGARHSIGPGKGPESVSLGIPEASTARRPPRLGEILPLPPAVRTELVKRAYAPSPVLPRGMTMDVLA